MIPKQHVQQHSTPVQRVLIVDDSKAMCAFLKKAIDADPALTVVGCALDPFEARDMIKQLNPDVLTLDIEMPKMDGLTFLRNLMRLRPMPVVMISSLTSAGAAVSLDALSIGATDFMVKRQIHSAEQLQDYTQSIRDLVRAAAGNSLPRKGVSGRLKITRTPKEFADWRHKLSKGRKAANNLKKVICIGASTGGPEAVKNVLETLDIAQTAVIVTQHMPGRFIEAFAARLDKVSDYKVEVSYDCAPLEAGCCYIAAGDSHTAIRQTASGLQCDLRDDEKVNGHQPAVDVLFKSAAATLGNSSVGVLLTGMGNDGAQGLKSMRDKGAFTVAQDEKSSAVWGMPGSAVRLEAADAILPLQEIGSTLSELLKG